MNQETAEVCKHLQRIAAHYYALAQSLVLNRYQTDSYDKTIACLEQAIDAQSIARNYAARYRSILTD